MIDSEKPRVIIVHGWASSPKKGWIDWLNTILPRDYEYEAVAPAMPTPRRPELEGWIETVLKSCVGSKKIILVGHSLGTFTILQVILRLPADVQIEKVILVSGFFVEPHAKYWQDYVLSNKDFTQIRTRANNIYVMYSTNDRMVEPTLTAKLARELHAKLIPVLNMGHFTNLKVKKLPIVLNAILETT